MCKRKFVNYQMSQFPEIFNRNLPKLLSTIVDSNKENNNFKLVSEGEGLIKLSLLLNVSEFKLKSQADLALDININNLLRM